MDRMKIERIVQLLAIAFVFLLVAYFLYRNYSNACPAPAPCTPCTGDKTGNRSVSRRKKRHVRPVTDTLHGDPNIVSSMDFDDDDGSRINHAQVDFAYRADDVEVPEYNEEMDEYRENEDAYVGMTIGDVYDHLTRGPDLDDDSGNELAGCDFPSEDGIKAFDPMEIEQPRYVQTKLRQKLKKSK